MAQIVVDGKEYEFPVGGDERAMQILLIKKAINGDKEAREMFLGGADEKLFFIGKEGPLWLKVTKDGMEVLN